MLTALGYNALRYTGVTTLARWLGSGGGGVVLCYHNVVAQLNGRADALGLHIASGTIERQIRWVAKHYTIVPLEEFVARVLRGTSRRGMAAITFDDGYAGVFNYAWPLLQDMRIPATVFVVAHAHGADREQGFWWDNASVLRAYSPAAQQRWLTECQGDRSRILGSLGPDASLSRAPSWCRPATWEAIAAAVRTGGGLDVGAHSATHRALPTLSDDELHRELVACRDVIRQHTGVNPRLFAYPYGLWDERIRRAAQAAGYRAAFTLASDPRTPKDDPWTLPRLSVPAGISDVAFEAWVAGLRPRWRHT